MCRIVHNNRASILENFVPSRLHPGRLRSLNTPTLKTFHRQCQVWERVERGYVTLRYSAQLIEPIKLRQTLRFCFEWYAEMKQVHHSTSTIKSISWPSSLASTSRPTPSLVMRDSKRRHTYQKNSSPLKPPIVRSKDNAKPHSKLRSYYLNFFHSPMTNIGPPRVVMGRATVDQWNIE